MFQPFRPGPVTTSKQLRQYFRLFQHDLDDQFDPISNHIKGSPTTRCQSSCETCHLTSTMAIKSLAAKLRKKLDKVKWQIDNKVLTKKQKDNKLHKNIRTQGPNKGI